jgi:tripartite-type tricarboxylate transporter receptor subunit TctC
MRAAKSLLRIPLITIFLWVLYAPLALSQTAPAKQFRVILTYPPGGASDIMGRIIAQKLGEIWGQTVLVDNRSGANGSIGIEYAARQPADGSSFVIGNLGPVAINPLISKVSYDMARDFQPVSLVAIGPTVLVTHPSMPARNLKEFIQLAREKPGAINFGTAGPGTLGHLGGEMMKRLAKIDIVHVPYKGTAPALTDVVTGQIEMMFADLGIAQQHASAGRLRLLAISTPTRSRAAPQLPTIAEAGLRGYEVAPWFGLVGPAGTPRDVVAKVNAIVAAALKSPDVLQRLNTLGYEPLGDTPEHFAGTIKMDIAKYANVVRAAGIKIQN